MPPIPSVLSEAQETQLVLLWQGGENKKGKEEEEDDFSKTAAHVVSSRGARVHQQPSFMGGALLGRRHLSSSGKKLREIPEGILVLEGACQNSALLQFISSPGL